MKLRATINTTIPTIKRLADGWYIGIFDDPNTTLPNAGPFSSMPAAIGAIDFYCSKHKLDNRIEPQECLKCGNLYDHRYPCVS